MDPACSGAGCIALIVAGGRGIRLGGELPKQYVSLAGEPLLRRAVRVFLDHPGVQGVRCVIHAGDIAAYSAATAGLELLPPVEGGRERQDSVRNGLESLVDLDPATVLVHDAARPLVAAATITDVLAALHSADGAIAALPVLDTLKRARGTIVAATVDRTDLWRAQTPQGFRFSAILAAHRRAAGSAMTDDAAVAEHAGLTVAIVPGAEENIKVTTSEDLDRANRLLMHASTTRVGLGFDVHRFKPGDNIVIGGVVVPHTHGLEGHSDADVALHAITDALLGAIAAGDIGTHFPPSDARWRNADSAMFLRHAMQLIRDRGGAVDHLDLTVICESPRIGPYREAMVTRIAEIVGLPQGQVSIKATTTERLGFTGRREGIAAQAVATVRVPAER